MCNKALKYVAIKSGNSGLILRIGVSPEFWTNYKKVREKNGMLLARRWRSRCSIKHTKDRNAGRREHKMEISFPVRTTASDRESFRWNFFPDLQ